MNISVIIPCAYDTRLTKCLETIDEDVEVVIALNGATPKVRQIALGSGAKICEIAERNIAKAVNRGIEISDSSNILLMNSDCIFAPGAINMFFEGLQGFKVAKGLIAFESKGFLSRILARGREYMNADGAKAYQPGLAFRKDIINDIGYYFDEDVHWAEDADFNRRIMLAGLSICYLSKAVLYHSPITVWTDLRSSFRYGIGRRIAEEKKLVGTSPPFKLSFGLIRTRFLHARTKKGTWVAAYMIVWLLAFSTGYLFQILIDPYGVSRRMGRANLQEVENET